MKLCCQKILVPYYNSEATKRNKSKKIPSFGPLELDKYKINRNKEHRRKDIQGKCK